MAAFLFFFKKKPTTLLLCHNNDYFQGCRLTVPHSVGGVNESCFFCLQAEAHSRLPQKGRAERRLYSIISVIA